MNSPRVIVDVGGEGRYDAAWNLNRSRVKTVGPDRGQPIPRLVIGRADAMPFRDGSVDQLIVERAPLVEAALHEIARVVAPGGTILLRHATFPGRDPHALARRILCGRVESKMRLLRGRWVRESEFRLSDGLGKGTGSVASSQPTAY